MTAYSADARFRIHPVAQAIIGWVALVLTIGQLVMGGSPSALTLFGAVASSLVVWPAIDGLRDWCASQQSGEGWYHVLLGYAVVLGTSLLALPWLLAVRLV